MVSNYFIYLLCAGTLEKTLAIYTKNLKMFINFVLVYFFREYILKNKTQKKENGGGMGSDWIMSMDGVSTESDDKVLELDNSDGCIHHCEYTSCTKLFLWVFYHNEKMKTIAMTKI